MIDRLLQNIAPHYCYGCTKIGYVLCPDCKYDIEDESFDGCLVCGIACQNGVCINCRTSYQKAWCVGERTDTLERLIDAYKFGRVKAAASPLAALLDARLPVLPPDTIVVPIPTTRQHIRQRGYDHAYEIAQRFTKLRKLTVVRNVKRYGNTMQRGQNKAQRIKQAKREFYCEGSLEDAPYLVIDDVVTTNATVRYAAQSLLDAGAGTVWVAVIARQGLDHIK